MTNVQLLDEKIKDSGMTITAIAKKSGILRATLYNKKSGKSEFSASEITKLTEVLHLSKSEREKIFFASEVELKDTTTKGG